jgi:hypothetical protein
MDTLAPTGFQVAYPSAQAPGITGPDHFYGHVDHHFEYRTGYHGPMPAPGEHAADHRAEFHGKAMHDPHGDEAPRGHR